MPKYIPSDLLNDFQKKFTGGDIWQIHTGDTWLIVFLYRNDQIEQNKDLPVYGTIKQEYTKLAQEYLDLSENNFKKLNWNLTVKKILKQNIEVVGSFTTLEDYAQHWLAATGALKKF
jgi:hypothetical protein